MGVAVEVDIIQAVVVEVELVTSATIPFQPHRPLERGLSFKPVLVLPRVGQSEVLAARTRNASMALEVSGVLEEMRALQELAVAMVVEVLEVCREQVEMVEPQVST